MPFNLKKVLKALLLSTNQPLAIKDLQAAIARFHDAAPASDAPVADGGTVPSGRETPDEADAVVEPSGDPELYAEVPELVTAAQIREVMDRIAGELRGADDGLLLIEGSTGYRLAIHPRFARWVRVLRQDPPPVKLSQSSLETLAVVAYRQPVTRSEIETIRGVSAEAGINRLLERELIYVIGRADAPGRPIQYGTSDQFLEFIGLKSLDELPASDVLSSRQINEWLTTAADDHPPGDTEMGLADEQLPLEPALAPGPAADLRQPETAGASEDGPPAQV